MNYGEIKTYDIANGPGVRVTLFVSGCTNACKGCFQPQTWDFGYGQEFDESAKERIFTELSHVFTQGLTLLGGDPFEPANQRALVPFLREVKEKYPGKDIWAFTGFLYEASSWTAASKRTSRTSRSGSAALRTSGSSTCPPPAQPAKSSSGTTAVICKTAKQNAL